MPVLPKQRSPEALIIKLLAIFLFFCLSALSASSPVTIRVWIMGGEAELIPELVKLFEKENPQIRVRVQALSWGGSFEKLVAAFLGGAPPDVCQLGTTMMSDFHSMKALESIHGLFSSGQLSNEDFLPESLKTNLFDGEFFGVPWYVDTRIVYYQPKILKQHGWNHFPATWDEFLKLGRQRTLLRKQNHDEIGYFASLQGFTFEMFYWQAGGEFSQPVSGKDFFIIDPLEKALEFSRSMRREGFYGKPRDSGLDYITEFDMGNYDIAVSGPWMASDLKKAANRLKNEWAAAVLPADKHNSSFLGGSNLVIFKDSRHKEAALKFLVFLSRPDIQAKWYEISSDLPANLKTYERPEIKDDQLLKIFKEQMNSSRVPPSGHEWTNFWEKTYTKLEEFEESNQPAREFAAQMNSTMAEVIKQSRASARPVFKGYWPLVALLPFIATGLYIFWGKTEKLKNRSAIMQVFLFLVPAMLLLLIFRLLPLSLAFAASLTDLGATNISNPELVNFTGINNYSRLLQDSVLRKSLKNTFYFMMVGIPLNLIIALSLALLINQFNGWKKSILALCLFLPSVVTTVASAVTWKWIFCQQSPINIFLNWLGVGQVGWLVEPDLALPSLIFFSVWRSFGLSMIILLAGLTTIDKELYESVKVDGGSSFDEFLHVTLPGLKRTLFTIAVGAFVANVQFFIEPYVLTGGGPKYSTLSVLLYSYNQAFAFFQLGYASSIISVLFVFFCLFNLWQNRMRRKFEGATR
ncbi:MAG: extracellular solute-binding protein [Candidatus Riflebacteria bacterium]